MTQYTRAKRKLLLIDSAYLDLTDKDRKEVDALLSQIIELIDTKIPVPSQIAEPIESVETDEGWIKGAVEVTVYEAKKETISFEEELKGTIEMREYEQMKQSK